MPCPQPSLGAGQQTASFLLPKYALAGSGRRYYGNPNLLILMESCWGAEYDGSTEEDDRGGFPAIIFPRFFNQRRTEKKMRHAFPNRRFLREVFFPDYKRPDMRQAPASGCRGFRAAAAESERRGSPGPPLADLPRGLPFEQGIAPPGQSRKGEYPPPRFSGPWHWRGPCIVPCPPGCTGTGRFSWLPPLHPEFGFAAG